MPHRPEGRARPLRAWRSTSSMRERITANLGSILGEIASAIPPDVDHTDAEDLPPQILPGSMVIVLG
jgi:hypothetical protein